MPDSEISTDQKIDSCIRVLLREYADEPLLNLREIGQQARLFRLLAQQFPECCPAMVGDGEGWNKPFQAPHKVGRVQMEVKIKKDRDTRQGERSDIVILRADTAIRLTRYPNGSQDIVARALADDVTAAIEIKAACSYDPRQRHLFRMDIAKLLRLGKENSISKHFVLIDKSLHFTGYEGCARGAVDQWHVEDNKRRMGGPHEAIRLSMSTGPCAAKPNVNVWDLFRSTSGNLEVRHRYATLC